MNVLCHKYTQFMIFLSFAESSCDSSQNMREVCLFVQTIFIIWNDIHVLVQLPGLDAFELNSYFGTACHSIYYVMRYLGDISRNCFAQPDEFDLRSSGHHSS